MQEGGMPSLFEVIHRSTLQAVHAQALRAIATICCIAESIAELEKVGAIWCALMYASCDCHHSCFSNNVWSNYRHTNLNAQKDNIKKSKNI